MKCETIQRHHMGRGGYEFKNRMGGERQRQRTRKVRLAKKLLTGTRRTFITNGLPKGQEAMRKQFSDDNQAVGNWDQSFSSEGRCIARALAKSKQTVRRERPPPYATLFSANAF
ncbi:hypothetical protein ElyMa_004654500 [Elysia marginata]|uniref:Uncharacterized protein n=1 Tax=Elysia marginata TaxID=1093978 RepID=A0AAV4I4A2_9GAST|nr:hypothetical protein ElyMa_004654500 [Elysia marginata]